MNPQTKTLYEAANVAYKAGTTILDRARAENRDLTPDEARQVDGHFDEAESKANAARRLERGDAFAASFAPARLPSPAGEVGAKSASASATDEARREFKAIMARFYIDGPDGLSIDAKRFVAEHGADFAGSSVKVARKDLSAGAFAGGGALVADTFRAEVIESATNVSAMRANSRVLPPVPGGSVITPTASHLSDASWTPEVATVTQDATTPFGQRVLTPHPLAKEVLVSNTLLRAAGVDAGAWVNAELGYVIGDAMENGFVNGNGSRQPLGLLNTAGLPTHTAATANQVYGDDVVNWAYRLPARYSANAKILCNRAFLRKVRAIRSFASGVAASSYLWTPGLGEGMAPTILDWPYILSDRFDDGLDGSDAWQTGAKVAVIGDFRYYWIVDAQELTIQRLVEIAARTNQTSFIGRVESDGMAVLSEAFYSLVIA